MKATSLFKSGFWVTFSTFAQRILALASNLILARLLMPSEFGVIGIAYIFWSFFTLFTQENAGKFIIYKGVEDKRYLDTAYTVSLCIGATVALALLLTSPLIAKFFNEPSLQWLLIPYAVNLVLSSAYYAYVGVLTRQMQYRDLANISLISSIARLLATTGSALAGLSYWSFAIGDTVAWVVGCILTRYKTGYFLGFRIVSEVRAEVLSYTLGVAGSSLGYYVNANLDNLVVGKFLGSKSLGFYNLAYQLTMAISVILSTVNLQLGMTVFAKQADDREQEKMLLDVVKKTAFLIIPIYSLFFLLINEQVVSFVFGSQWTPLCSAIPGLLVFAYFRVINSSLDAMLCAKGYSNVNAKVNLQIAPIAVIGFILGAMNGGILGVSIAVAIVLGVIWTLYWWRVGCKTLGWTMMKFLIPCFLAIAIASPAIAIAYYLPLILKPIAFMAIYLLTVRILLPKQFGEVYMLLVKAIEAKMSHK